MRWEVTRRNPYYDALWKLARAEYRREVTTDPREALFRQAAIAILGSIGVSGEPPDPATLFAELGVDELDQGWLSGAVHPVTMRGLAAILIAALPKEALRMLGNCFLTAACEDVEEQLPKEFEAIQALMMDQRPEFDNYPDEPFVAIDPTVSERKIAKAMDLLLEDWKAERGLEDRRDRSDRYEEYLETWDLREGWRDGVYHRGAEHTFVQIAETTKRTISTLSNQYCRAFELITGQPFSRELWFTLFGPINLPELAGRDVQRMGRPPSTSVARDVPDSVVSPPECQNSEATSLIDVIRGDDEVGYNLLLSDIEAMLDKGRSDAKIAKELGNPKKAVAFLRQHREVLSLRP
jgi:hypothetical protein